MIGVPTAWRHRGIAFALIYGSVAMAFAGECLDATPELAMMEHRALAVYTDAGMPIHIDVLIADSPDERAAGFQHLCPNVFPRTAILFEFESDIRTRFHMFNVYGPLDIAFIDADGHVVDVQHMAPYEAGSDHHPLYGSSLPFRYALEMDAGRFAAIGLARGSRIVQP